MEPLKTKNIIDGFGEDLKLVVSLYGSEAYSNCTSSHKECRLKDFFRFWNENHMDCIFANRFDPRELLEAITEMNKTLVAIFSDARQHELNKIVAIYFLLCLYVKQPVRLRRTVRLTCDQIIQLQKLPQDLSCAGFEADVKFVLDYLKSSGAIDIVEESVIYGPSMLINRGVRKANDLQDCEAALSSSREHDFTNFIHSRIDPLISELDSANVPYKETKNLLKLDEHRDPTLEFESNESIDDLLNQAKALLRNIQNNDS